MGGIVILIFAFGAAAASTVLAVMLLADKSVQVVRLRNLMTDENQVGGEVGNK